MSSEEDSFDDEPQEINTDDENDNESKHEEEEEESIQTPKKKPREPKRKKDRMDGSFMGDTTILSALYRQLIEVQNKYNCSVNIPQFAFIGIQSSGKSSALSQMLNMPSGVVQDGTGTRCPVRFTLKQDDSISERRITVKGEQVTNYIDMTTKVCEYTKDLGEKFSPTILEVEISGPNIPNFVIVDLPGIIKKRSNKDSQTLKKMTKRFLCETLPNNAGFAYIPVFIRAAADIENDSDPDDIDRLCNSVRPNWRRESIIVINKIDLKWSRDTDGLLDYMNKLTKDNPESTVICMCNPNGARIDANPDKVKEVEKYIRDIPNIEKDKWDEKIRKLGDSTRLRKFVEKYCFVTRLKDIMRDRSIEIVKGSIGPVKAKLERVERKFVDDIKNMELQLHNCKAENIRNEKARFDDEFLKIHLAFYKGEMGHQVSDYGSTWSEEMQRFFKSETKIANSVWVQNYYLSPTQLLQAFEDKKQPKDSKDTSKRLERQIKARLLGSAAIYRAIELWRAMISFMSLSKYTIEQVLNSRDFFHHHLYPTVEDTVQKLLLKASENLKNGCIWLGTYICWKLKEDAKLLHKNLQNQKMQLKQVDKQMEKIYKFTIDEYQKYVHSIVKDFITTAKVEPRDLVAIFDSLATHHYVNLGKIINKDFKKLDKLNERGAQNGTEERRNIYQREIDEMTGQQSRKPKDDQNNNNNNNDVDNEEEVEDDSSSGEEPIEFNQNNSDEIKNDNDNDNNDGEDIEDIDQNVDLVGTYTDPSESNNSHNKFKDTDFFFHVYGLPNKMFNNRDDVEFIRFYAGVHWKYIKFHVIKTIQEKFSHRIMFHIKQRSTDLARALREGVEQPKLDSLVRTLALKANIAIDVLGKAVEDLIKNTSESSKLVSKSFPSLSNDELERTYGVNTENLRKQIARLKTDLSSFRKSKDEINHNLYQIENSNSANFDPDDTMMID